MTKKWKMKTRRRLPGPDINPAKPNGKRRLPRPPCPPSGRPTPPARPPCADSPPPPAVTEMVEQLLRVCHMAHLSAQVVIGDWAGMIEASLRLYADNARSLAFSGHFIEDPPAVKEHYRRARERYLRATEKYPAVYREMQTAFSHTFALLQLAAEPGLAAYAHQTEVNPDFIGQVFLAAVEPGPDWWPYFSPWPEALARARRAIPDGREAVMEVLLAGHLRYRQAVAEPLHPEPGDGFEQWYADVLPYCEPVIIGPQQIGTSADMLAMAAMFPDWAVAAGLVLFYPQPVYPLLDQMVQINSYLFNLNGYDLGLMQAALDILNHRQQQAAAAPPLEPDLPDQSPPEQPPAPTASRRRTPDQATFAELYRQLKP